MLDWVRAAPLASVTLPRMLKRVALKVAPSTTTVGMVAAVLPLPPNKLLSRKFSVAPPDTAIVREPLAAPR